MKTSSVHFAILLLMSLLIVKDVKCQVRCDRSLVQAFMLKGLKTSINERMEVCPMVHERCCSLMDEIVIVKYWKRYSEPALARYNQIMFNSLNRVMEFHKLFFKLSKRDIPLHYVSNRWVPYIHRLCEISGPQSQLEQTDQQRIVMINQLFPGDGPVDKIKDNIFLQPVSHGLKQSMIDKATINLYLAIILHTLNLNRPFRYQHELNNLFYAERSIDTIDLSKRIMYGMNFKKIKTNFLGEVRRAKKQLIVTFENLLADYDGREGMDETIELIRETFTKKFVDLLTQIEAFMINYNQTNQPRKRYIMINKFRSKVENKVLAILNTIEKFRAGLEHQNKSANANIEGKLYKIEAATYNKNVLEKQKLRKREKKKVEVEVDLEQQKVANERSYDPTNDVAVDADAAASEKGLRKHMEAQINKFKTLPIDEERRLTDGPKEDAITKFREEFQKRTEELKKSMADSKARKIKDRSLIQIPENKASDAASDKANGNTEGVNKQAGRILAEETSNSSAESSGDVEASKNEKHKSVIDDVPTLKNLSPEERKKYKILMKLRYANPQKARKLYLGHQFSNFIGRKVVRPYINEAFFEPKAINVYRDENVNFVECNMEGRHIFKHFLVNNKHKTRFCMERHAAFQRFNPNVFEKSLIQQKAQNMAILSLKKTIYCAICDANYQRSFLHEKQMVVYEEQFCQDLMEKFESYIAWKNIILIEYMDLTLQMITCYETPATFVDYPIPSFLDKAKRMIFFVKRCLKNRNRKDFMMYCHFLCTDFKMKGYSQLIDGDFRIIDLFVLKIYNFARKVGLTPLPPIQLLSVIDEEEVDRDHGDGQKAPPIIDPKDNPDNIVTLSSKITKIYDKLVDDHKKRREPEKSKTPPLKTRFIQTQPDKFEKLDEVGDGLPTDKGPDGGLNNDQLRAMKYERQRLRDEMNDRTKKMALRERAKKKRMDEAMITGFVSMHHSSGNIYNQTKGSYRKLHKKLEKKDNADMRLTKALKLIRRQKKELKRTRVLEEEENPHDTVRTDEYVPDEIFERKQHVYVIDCYRAFYTRNTMALNPIKLSESINITEDKIEMILNRQYKKHNPESFDQSTIVDYFSVSSHRIEEFNNDVKGVDFEEFFDAMGNPMVQNKALAAANKTKKQQHKNNAGEAIKTDLTQAHGREDAFIADYIDQKETDKGDEPLAAQMLTKH